MREAYYFERQDHNVVLCTLCPHYCTIPEDSYGRCRVRVNKDGILYTLNYGEISAFGIDPVEKKPLRHFYPGQKIVSIGSFGCNLDAISVRIGPLLRKNLKPYGIQLMTY